MVKLLQQTVWWFLKKINIEVPYDLAIPLLDKCPKELKTGSNRYLCTHVDCLIIHNSQKVETTDHLPMQETQETRVQSLGLEDPLEKGTATHSRILAWRIPWTEEPGGLQFIGHESDMTEATQHTQKQLKCPSTYEWINKMYQQYIQIAKI